MHTLLYAALSLFVWTAWVFAQAAGGINPLMRDAARLVVWSDTLQEAGAKKAERLAKHKRMLT
jgi:hypothetical protein